MPRPVTPFVGCDSFVVNEKSEVLLIKRTDNGMWALPGGCQDLGESPRACAERECLEESGYQVRVTRLLGVFSSQCYEYVNYPYKDVEFTHLVFSAEVVGGAPRASSETSEIAFFARDRLPELTDGHDVRIQLGFEFLDRPNRAPHFE